MFLIISIISLTLCTSKFYVLIKYSNTNENTVDTEENENIHWR